MSHQLGTLGEAYLEAWDCDKFGVATATMAQMAKGTELDVGLSRPSHALITGEMLLTKTECQPQDGGLWGLNRWYFEGEYKLTGFVEYALETSERQVPIETHFCIDALVSTYNGKVIDGKIKFPKTVKDVLPSNSNSPIGELTPNGSVSQPVSPMFGVEAFMDVAATFSATSVEPAIPSQAAGTVVQYPDTPEKIPRLGAGIRDWLVLPISARKRGKVYEVTRRWMLSGRGGWSREIYS
jgi:hypothetical protein